MFYPNYRAIAKMNNKSKPARETAAFVESDFLRIVISQTTPDIDFPIRRSRTI
jgi:hypothetical protein